MGQLHFQSSAGSANPFPHGELHLLGVVGQAQLQAAFADRGCRQSPRKGPEGEEKELELEQELKGGR